MGKLIHANFRQSFEWVEYHGLRATRWRDDGRHIRLVSVSFSIRHLLRWFRR